MTDDLIILASTYLDGEATIAERAQVEGDAELLAEVERLRRVRAVLSDTSDNLGEGATAPLSTRERHLAAALDVWDRLPAESGDPTPAGADAAGAAGGASITAPISMRDQRNKRRPANTRLLTVAAVVIVLAGAGFVVRSALDNSSSDNSTNESAGIDASNEAPSPEVLAAEEFATGGEGDAADEVADAAAPAAAIESEAIAGGGPDQGSADVDLDVLLNNADLARFANNLILSRTAATAAAEASQQADDSASANSDATQQTTPPTLAPPVELCGLIDDFVGFAYWQAPGLFDSPIAVGIDNSTNKAVAYHPDTCTLIARTPLP